MENLISKIKEFKLVDFVIGNVNTIVWSVFCELGLDEIDIDVRELAIESLDMDGYEVLENWELYDTIENRFLEEVSNCFDMESVRDLVSKYEDLDTSIDIFETNGIEQYHLSFDSFVEMRKESLIVERLREELIDDLRENELINCIENNS